MQPAPPTLFYRKSGQCNSLSEVYTASPGLTCTSEQFIDANSMNSSNVILEGSPQTILAGIPTYVVVRNDNGPITLVPLNTVQVATAQNNIPANKVPIPRLTKENMCDPAVYKLPLEEEEAAEKMKNSKRKRPQQRRIRNKIFRVPTSKRVRNLVQKVSNTMYRCTICGISFPHNYLCEYHIRSHIGEMSFSCSHCGKCFAAMHMLRKHRQSHEEGCRHLCKTCGRGFRSLGNLREHEKMHLDVPPPFKCNLCEKCFYFRASYNGHMESHFALREHTCEQCAKSYKSRRHLNEHVARIHEGVTRHHCPTCGKGFYRRSSFRQHLRLHTSERPYGCDICGRAFNEPTNLKRHKRIHEKNKPYHTTFVEVEVETVLDNK